ncbi:NAD(P)/FAD-dependent oxidoreductase [PVC group bacterium]|nr:NAD(P)/FAD-dependent oxidoreductase [PVC group bacterium]
MRTHYDCLIIGGGLSGAMAGYHLATHGYDVALLEKSIGPHHKVCGEFLSPEAIPYLEEMNVSLDRTQFPSIHTFVIHSSRLTFEGKLDRPGLGISRFKLDETLLKNAKAAGVKVFRGVFVMKLYQQTHNNIEITTNKATFFTKTLFIATGKHDLDKKQIRKGKDCNFIGLKMHLKLNNESMLKLRERIRLYIFNEGYAGILPIEGSLANLCFIIKKQMFRSKEHDIKNILEYICHKNKELKKILRNAAQLSETYAIAPIPYGYMQKTPHAPAPNIYTIGDQYAVTPSLTGDGMAIALATGRAAFWYYHMKQSCHTSRMQKSIFYSLKKQMRWSFRLHRVFKNNYWLDAFLLILKAFPRSFNYLFRKTRAPELSAMMEKISSKPIKTKRQQYV